MQKQRSAVIDTIRKLMRMARQKGPEAKIARQRAEELMERYGVHVSAADADDERRLVNGVAGVYWREQLLDRLARANECRLLKVDRGQGHFDTVVTGYAADVEHCLTAYSLVQTRIVAECVSRWRDFVRTETWRANDDLASTRSGYRSPWQSIDEQIARLTAVKEQLTGDKSFDAWARAFLGIAAEEYGKRLDPPLRRTSTFTYYGGEPPRIPRDVEDSEFARVRADRAELSKNFGEVLAKRLQQEAVSMGRVASVSAPVLPRRVMRMLTAASSWLPPPPPPTRATFLDFDPPASAPAKRPDAPEPRVELDLEERKAPIEPRAVRELDLD